MLKAGAKGTDKAGQAVQLVVLGLSHINLRRLKDGRPIYFDGAELELPGVQFMIFAGETEQSMARELDDFIGSATEVRIDPRLRD